jgi:hypothetical protein
MFFSQEQIDILEASLSIIGLFPTALSNRINSATILMNTETIDIMKAVSDQLVQMIDFLQTLTTSSAVNSSQSSDEGILLSNLITNFTDEFFLSGMEMCNHLCVKILISYSRAYREAVLRSQSRSRKELPHLV